MVDIHFCIAKLHCCKYTAVKAVNYHWEELGLMTLEAGKISLLFQNTWQNVELVKRWSAKIAPLTLPLHSHA